MGNFKKYVFPTTLAAIQPAALAYSRIAAEHATAAIIVGGTAGALVAVLGARNTYGLDRENAELRRQNVLAAACWAILDLKIIDVEELGFHAFRKRRTLMHPIEGVHMRVARLRPKRPLPPSSIGWIGNKGAIGYTRYHEPSNIVWWRLVEHPLSAYVGCTAADWERVPEEFRMGFTHADWVIAQRYSGVVVAPVISRGTWAGCVTVDCATDEGFCKLWAKRKDIEKICQDAANSMAAVIE